MQPDGPYVVAYLPYTDADRTFLAIKGLEWERFYTMFEVVAYDELFQFEVFSRYGSNSFMVPAGEMIPICRYDEYGKLFLVQFFSDSSRTIRGPATTEEVLDDLKPLLDSGCRPILFTKQVYPVDSTMDPLALRIALERTVGFHKEDDAVLAQVIAEGRKT